MLRAEPARIARFRAELDRLGYDALQRSLRGGFPRAPFPPFAEFSRTLRRVSATQRTWLAVLLLGRRLPSSEVRAALGDRLVDDLLTLGVLQAHGDRVDTGGLGLVCYRDRYLLATLDPTYPTNRDPRLTLYVGPSSYRLADALPAGHRFGAVLDMCAGPGLLGIVLAPVADRVLLADVLEPAVEAARFNAALNGVSANVAAVRSDLYAGLGNRKFDFVVMNAPFVAMPEEEPGSVYADGGPTGMRLLGPLLEGLPGRLRRGGWALGYLEGPGDRQRPFFAERLAEAVGRRVSVELLLVERTTVGGVIAQMREREALLRIESSRIPGRRKLFRDQGATHYYCMFARFRPGAGGVTVVNAIPRLR